jgi:hypothetical protein
VPIYHSFEFATNEYINDLSCVTLETASTESGSKDFIVVGTTIDRGEDLAAKGAVRSPLCFFFLAYFNLTAFLFLGLHFRSR